jgi:hypothetical protein
MAYTVINAGDTLEQVRVKLNNLTQVDFGDPAQLASAGIVATSIVGALVEVANTTFAESGWTIRDSSSSFQIVGNGQTLDVKGTSNQINAVVSLPDTLTLSLTNNVTIPNNLTVTNNITATGSTHTLGTVEISGNTIRSTDSTRLVVNDILRANSFSTSAGNGAFYETGGFPTIESNRADKFLVFDATPIFNTGHSIFFEGSTADNFETQLTVANPTADRVITIPNITGTLITTGDTETVSNTMLTGSITGGKLLDSAIVEAKIASGAVAAAKLKSVVTLSILNSTGGVLKTLYGAGA